jgi:HEAT repeat protein
MTRMALRRLIAVLVLSLIGAGLWAGSNWSSLQARYAAHRLRSAATDEDRARCADDLASRGDEGLGRLLDSLKDNEPAVRLAAAGAFDRYLNALPENDPQSAAISGRIIDLFGQTDDPGREAILSILPTLLKRGATTHSVKCKPMVAAALKMPSVAARLAAIRTAMNPEIGLRAEIVPLLEASEPEVRRAALFALGPATDAEASLGDEALFHWLHDADAGVRAICREALASRGRSETEIALGRRLVDPDAGERLKLLLDLRFDDDVPDPEPWLERLSRDADPGVRAGAVRVMMELSVERRTPPPAWIARIAESDADTTVRHIAGFYRRLPQIEGP